jgi:beta-phosphoglucomutase family hydrolase
VLTLWVSPAAGSIRDILVPTGVRPSAEVAVNAAVELSRNAFDAVVMDLDGVVTDTASLHEMAWKRMFDGFLATRPTREGEEHRPFTNDDYRRFVDGMPRFDGAEGFLVSRGIAVPAEEIHALAAQKDGDFHDLLEKEGAVLLPGSVALLTALRRAGFRTAIVSASRNCKGVLGRAGLLDYFDARVDGVVADELGLPGKPDPTVYLEAAERLRTPPQRCVVVEDALAGVEAGRRGGFGLVVGVDRAGHGQELLDHGADVIVRDLAGVDVAPSSATGSSSATGRSRT